jgi:hypothetical protein
LQKGLAKEVMSSDYNPYVIVSVFTPGKEVMSSTVNRSLIVFFHSRRLIAWKMYLISGWDSEFATEAYHQHVEALTQQKVCDLLVLQIEFNFQISLFNIFRWLNQMSLCFVVIGRNGI